MVMVKAERLCKQYTASQDTVKAVADVSFSVSAGEAVAIMGPSGSGKSTLLKLIGLILQPDGGTIEIEGEKAAELTDRGRCRFRNQKFGYIAQDFALIEEETVYRNIQIPLLYHPESRRKDDRERIYTAAGCLGIERLLKKKAGKLSGGEQQRAAIARALVCDPPIYLADEPTSSLDAANKECVLRLLLGLCREKGKTLILATHDRMAAEMCDRILQMRDGAFLFEHGDNFSIPKRMLP